MENINIMSAAHLKGAGCSFVDSNMFVFMDERLLWGYLCIFTICVILQFYKWAINMQETLNVNYKP